MELAFSATKIIYKKAFGGGKIITDYFTTANRNKGKTVMNFNDREKIIALTPLWKGERLPDGRPKVEDKYLNAFARARIFI